MKKVSLLILLVIVLSTVLMAAVPTKMIRLTIINKSEYDVYMQLEGSDVTEAFYYLTIPTGSRDEPVVKVFTIMSDMYSRTTWQCNGIRSSGTLVADGNLRLTFLPCGEFQCSFTGPTTLQFWGCVGEPVFVTGVNYRQGEPRMEKVAYFRYLQYGRPSWASADLYNGYWTAGCFTWYWRSRTYRLPRGCWFRYQY